MDFRSIIMGLTFALIWSSAFTSARIIVQSAPPFMVSSLRFFISGAIALGIAYALGQRIKFTRSQWRAIIVFGVCQNALYLGLFFFALQSIEASLGSIIASTMPLIVAFVAAVFLRDGLSSLGVIGLIAGFCGVVLIMYNRMSAEIDPLGLALCAVGVIALSIATLSVKSASTGDTLLLVVGLQMWVGAVALLIPSLVFETWAIDWSPRFGIALGYTIIAPGIIATYIWFKLVNRIGATKAATFHFLNPFFGVAVAAVVLGEGLTLVDIIGVAIIMAGILAVQLSRAKT